MSQSLFTGTYDLAFETTSCPGDTKGFQLPAIGVTATGDVYEALAQLLPCSSDTDCSGTGAACLALALALAWLAAPPCCDVTNDITAGQALRVST